KAGLSALRPIGRDGRERLATLLGDNAQEFRTYKLPDGSKKSLQGNWYDTIGEYEMAYKKRFGVNPSDDEIAAYFTVREFQLWDWYGRNIAMYRDKARIGGQQVSLL